MVSDFDKFTERARKILTLAQEEAVRFNHNYIGTEHLLLGIVRERDSVGARVLTNIGVNLSKVRSAVEFIIGRGETPIANELGLTPRSKKVVELALDEARRLNHHYVGSEHLPLGLVREVEGIAAGVLGLGVSLFRVRVEVMIVCDPALAQFTIDDFLHAKQVIQGAELLDLLVVDNDPTKLQTVLASPIGWETAKWTVVAQSAAGRWLLLSLIKEALTDFRLEFRWCEGHDAIRDMAEGRRKSTLHVRKDCPYCKMWYRAFRRQKKQRQRLSSEPTRL